MNTMSYAEFSDLAETVANDDYTILSWLDIRYHQGSLTEVQFVLYMHYATWMYSQGSVRWAD